MNGFAAAHSLSWAGAGGAEGAARLAGAMLVSLGLHAGAALLIDLPAGPAGVTGGPVSVRLVAAPARTVLEAARPEAAMPGTPEMAVARVPAVLPAAATATLARPVSGRDTRSALAPFAVRPASARVMPAGRSDTRATAAPPARAESVSAEAPPPPPDALAARAAAPAAATRVAAASPASAAVPRGARAPASSTPVLASPGPVPPRPAAGNPAPEYPLIARRRGQQGRVLLRLEVAPDGTPSAAAVVHSSGVAALDRAARAAVARWRFQPARRDGRAVAATVEVPVVFRLDGRG